jgi:hypothetical protein
MIQTINVSVGLRQTIMEQYWVMQPQENAWWKWALNIPTYLHEEETFLRSLELLSYSRNSLPFMEPEGSSPCSQKPAAGAYPTLDESSMDT